MAQTKSGQSTSLIYGLVYLAVTTRTEGPIRIATTAAFLGQKSRFTLLEMLF